ncbi:MAG: hypothetical protein GY711_10070 [bacterium]|nr:hypothetical protein [bacterium]
MSADKRPSTFSEVVPGPNVVVQFQDGSIARLDQVDEVLSIGADDDEEVYIVYMCRGRMTCVHFLEEPDGFGALLADASSVLAMQWPYLKENQRASLVRQMGTAVALGIEDRAEEGRGVLDRGLAFANAECTRGAHSVHLFTGFCATIVISGLAWLSRSASAPPEGTLLEQLLFYVGRASDPFAALPTLWNFAFVGGPLGGLLSLTLLRTDEANISPHATQARTAWGSVGHILVSVVTALVVLLAVRSGIAATGLVQAEPGSAYLLLAIAGGLGSNWATNILKTITVTGADENVAEPPAPQGNGAD